MEFEDVNGILTETYHIGARDVNPYDRKQTLDIFFCPGNPGSLFVYLPWLQGMHTKLTNMSTSSWLSQYDVSIHGCSHANHHFINENEDDEESITRRTGERRGKYQSYGLAFQTNQFEAFIQETLYKRRTTSQIYAKSSKLILIGHSIGCYMILDILNRNLNICDTCLHVELLMPFILWERLTLNHTTKLRFLRYTGETFTQWYADLALRFLQSMSTQKRLSLFKYAKHIDAESAQALAGRFFSHRLVNNFIAMGFDEIKAIADSNNRNNVFSILKKVSGLFSIHAVYTNDDDWSPLGDALDLDEALTFFSYSFLPDVTHGFSTKMETSKLVADTIVGEINNRMNTIHEMPMSRL